MSTDQTQATAEPFSWTEVKTVEEMRAFYLSKLDAIRAAAKACGYAIGLHGSLKRDLDLIAVPWINEHADADALARSIHRAACGLQSKTYQWEQKPAGRIAVSFPICWTADLVPKLPSIGHIDLSVVGHLAKKIGTDAPASAEAERAKLRPIDYDRLRPQQQWEIDKSLGILDWDGT